MDYSNCNNFFAKTMLKGSKNLELYNSITKNCRKVMTFPLLKILSHKIATESWSESDKQSIWTAFSLAFFGSFRFGELLPDDRHIFNAREALLWSDIQFLQDFVVIHIKITKTKAVNGEYVDLFLQESSNYCPVKALSRLKLLRNPCNSNVPVFALDNGSFLTCKIINGILLKLLTPVLGNDAKFISAHSFRAALASALASNPEIANAEDIKLWGRWNSSSYTSYTRLKVSQKRSIYNKILAVLK
jgi:hypothetical protein